MNLELPEHVLIVPYKDPDLDGVASAIGLEWLLREQGASRTQLMAATYGTPDAEALFALKEFGLPPALLPDASHLTTPSTRFILVDASDLHGFPSGFDPNRVIEVIDHRSVNGATVFSHAKVDIQAVGAAATLIAERIVAEARHMPPHVAGLLYSAIVSNTVNFKSAVTTDRDHAIAAACLNHIELRPDYIRRMFESKSDVSGPIEKLLAKVARIEISDRAVGIIQLEVVDAEAFARRRASEIRPFLTQKADEMGLEHLHLTCLDPMECRTFLLPHNNATRALLSQALPVDFDESGLGTMEQAMLRKEMAKAIKNYLQALS